MLLGSLGCFGLLVRTCFDFFGICDDVGPDRDSLLLTDWIDSTDVAADGTGMTCCFVLFSLVSRPARPVVFREVKLL